MIVSPGCTRSVSLAFISFFSPFTIRTILIRDVDPRSVTPPASDSACSTVVPLSDRVGARRLHLAEHVDAFSARGTKIVSPSLSVMFFDAVLEILQVDSEDLGDAFFVGQRRPGGRLSGRRSHDHRLAARPSDVVDPARASASMRVMLPVSGYAARLLHLADDEDPLAAVLLDADRDLRVLEVAVGRGSSSARLRSPAASGRRP